METQKRMLQFFTKLRNRGIAKHFEKLKFPFVDDNGWDIQKGISQRLSFFSFFSFFPSYFPFLSYFLSSKCPPLANGMNLVSGLAIGSLPTGVTISSNQPYTLTTRDFNWCGKTATLPICERAVRLPFPLKGKRSSFASNA